MDDQPNAVTMRPSEAALHREIARLRTEVDTLMALLAPFGRLYKEHHHYMRDEAPIYGVGDSLITAGDLRRAAAHTQAEGEEKP
jgi:hypothetical protein